MPTVDEAAEFPSPRTVAIEIEHRPWSRIALDMIMRDLDLPESVRAQAWVLALALSHSASTFYMDLNDLVGAPCAGRA